MSNTSLSNNQNGYKQGVIRMLEKTKSGIGTYGFIADQDGVDRFFHWSQLSPNSFKPFHFLYIGALVRFLPTEKNGKMQATSVEYVPRAPKSTLEDELIKSVK